MPQTQKKKEKLKYTTTPADGCRHYTPLPFTRISGLLDLLGAITFRPSFRPKVMYPGSDRRRLSDLSLIDRRGPDCSMLFCGAQAASTRRTSNSVNIVPFHMSIPDNLNASGA